MAPDLLFPAPYWPIWRNIFVNMAPYWPNMAPYRFPKGNMTLDMAPYSQYGALLEIWRLIGPIWRHTCVPMWGSTDIPSASHLDPGMWSNSSIILCIYSSSASPQRALLWSGRLLFTFSIPLINNSGRRRLPV